MIEKITIGYELPKARWQQAAENLKTVAPVIANILQHFNHENMGKDDAEDFMTDMMLAQTALLYVAEFATDKCRIIPIPERGPGKV